LEDAIHHGHNIAVQAQNEYNWCRAVSGEINFAQSAHWGLDGFGLPDEVLRKVYGTPQKQFSLEGEL
jgi:hypothetical protein